MPELRLTGQRPPVRFLAHSHARWCCQSVPAKQQVRHAKRRPAHKHPLQTLAARSATQTDILGGMRGLAEDTQEALASGNPQNLKQNQEDLLANMSKEMADVRKKVLGKPGVLQGLVQQLRQGKLEEKAQAAELLFCVVGQGPDADAAATKQALDAGAVEAILLVLQDCATKPKPEQRSDQALQQFMALLIAILAQVTLEDHDVSVTRKAVSQNAVKLLRSVFEILSGEGAQQNVVSMLWHWSSKDAAIREEVFSVGIAEMQTFLLSSYFSPVQRQVAADQLSAYVSVPDQQEFTTEGADSTLANDLINAGAAAALVDMLRSQFHQDVQCSAAQALAVLATFSPKSKLKLMSAGAFKPVVHMLRPSAPNYVRETGAMLLVTLATGDPRDGPVFTQTEAVVQFAGIGAVTALAEMLRPTNSVNVRIMAIQGISVMVSSFDSRVQKAVVSSGVLPVLLDILRILSGTVSWDPKFDELKQPTLFGMRLKCAEILASVGIENADNCSLLVEMGAVPEILVVCSDEKLPEAERESVTRLVQYLCQTDEDILAILSAMMLE